MHLRAREDQGQGLDPDEENCQGFLWKEGHSRGLWEVESRFKVESRFEHVESRFEEEDFSETPTRAQFEKPNTDLFKETLKPGPQVREDADLTKKENDELVPVRSPTRIPTVQSHVGGYPSIQGGGTRSEKEKRWIIQDVCTIR